ncbi:GWxTD domain-containing protein [candidate division WOR-3 bacterium]|uniref:GWxTD domain-containing protein n=1 Tax=candidate division WOR-3 bacterium TaxID=2052148 RepID=A0A9D5KA49_UNCW3|nr:GWxTD domain-containing protein [candidate division WOR-3 bacterium]MBD3365206.1 GWxTD domain-containing protein [candidate division WOR-3 bacterium]
MRLLLLLVLVGQTSQPEYSFRHIIEDGQTEDGFYVTAYVSIPYSTLPFKIEDSLYKSSYHLILQLVDKKKNLYGDEAFDVVVTEDAELIRSQTLSVSETLRVTLPKGNYKGNLSFRAIGASRSISKEFQKDLSPRALSSIRLKTPNGNYLIGRPYDNRDTLIVSASINKEVDSLNLVLSGAGSSKQISRLKDSVRESSWQVILSDFASGVYEVKVKAFNKGKKVDERLAWFKVRNPFRFEKNRYDELVDKLIYLIGPQERKQMKSVPPERRQETWDSFWSQRDPTPKTEYNEELEDYFAKITYCEKNFGHGDRGYLSDRAQVYMKLGPPDQVEDHPFEMNTNPYIVWTYNMNNLKIVFEDVHGFGEYELVYPPGFLSSLSRLR